MQWVPPALWDPPSGPSNNTSALPCGHSLPGLTFPGLGGMAAPASTGWQQPAFFPAWGCWAGLDFRAVEAQPREALTGVLGQHRHVYAGQIPSSAYECWEKGGGDEAPSSISIQKTMITYLLCLSVTSLGIEEMGANDSLLTYFLERKERKLRFAVCPQCAKHCAG